MILFPTGKPTKRETFDEYRAAGGYQPVSPTSILPEITASGLRGRGGAGFPAGKKWAIAAEAPIAPHYLVCNAGEDEPGSFKDRVLIEHRPHLVLEGMILASRAIQAEQAYLYLNETYGDCFTRMAEAISEAGAAGYLGHLKIYLQPAPTAYVAGEDSASLEVLEGKPPLPRQKPPYPVTIGLFGKPTVVNNVETLANVPPIVRNGSAWFRKHGTSESPGTMIFCLGEEMNCPGAYELPLGTSLRHLYENLGGGMKEGRKVRAILPGGPSCGFLSEDQLDISMDPESLKKAGSTLGCGVMRFYSEGTCMVEETLRIAQFFARESCGQCPACRMETNMLSAMLERIQQGKADAALFDQFSKILDFNRGKGYCALINMPGPPITSALRLFRADFEHHLHHGVCPGFRTLVG
jgi:NADH-quinone oxidoreductase subunit F